MSDGIIVAKIDVPPAVKKPRKDRVKELERQVKDLELQLLGIYENEKKRAVAELRLIKRMPKTEPILVYPTQTTMLEYVLHRGNLPSWRALTKRQQSGVVAAIGVEGRGKSIYNGLRKAINNEVIRQRKDV